MFLSSRQCHPVSLPMSSTLVVVIDMDQRYWGRSGRLQSTIEAISFYVASLCQSLPFPSTIKLAVIAAFSDKSETILSGDWKRIADLSQALDAAMQSHAPPGTIYESPMGQAVSRALTFANKRRSATPARIVVFDCSVQPTDFSSQSVALSNCGWAAIGASESLLARVHVVSLASATPSASLLALCGKTGGTHIPSQFTQSSGELLQALLFHLTASESILKQLKCRPQLSTLHMGTVCVCHNKSIDRGYVCSICLSIYCSETAGICAVCGSRIRREAKDEQPISAQVFGKLFDAAGSGVHSLFP